MTDEKTEATLFICAFVFDVDKWSRTKEIGC